MDSGPRTLTGTVAALATPGLADGEDGDQGHGHQACAQDEGGPHLVASGDRRRRLLTDHAQQGGDHDGLPAGRRAPMVSIHTGSYPAVRSAPATSSGERESLISNWGSASLGSA